MNMSMDVICWRVEESCCNELGMQRSVFYFAPWGELWPPGVKLAPRGEVITQGWRTSLRPFRPSVHPSVLLNIRECSPLRVNKGVNNTHRWQSSLLWNEFTPVKRVHPCETSSPLWNEFTPVKRVHPWGQTSSLGANSCCKKLPLRSPGMLNTYFI
jgi:hypothetical protein